MKKFCITYEAEKDSVERNFEIKIEKLGNLGCYAKTHVYEVIRPERKFFGRCKFLGEYLYDVDHYETLEEIAQASVIKAMHEQDYREKVKKMWKGA